MTKARIEIRNFFNVTPFKADKRLEFRPRRRRLRLEVPSAGMQRIVGASGAACHPGLPRHPVYGELRGRLAAAPAEAQSFSSGA